MNREIKFNGKSKYDVCATGKCDIEKGQWIEGDLIHRDGFVFIGIKIKISDSSWIPICNLPDFRKETFKRARQIGRPAETAEEMKIMCDGMCYIEVEVDPETIGQYTGFNKLFENNIIEVDEYLYPIIFVLGTFGIEMGDDIIPLVDLLNKGWKCEPIGNIYDNSEMVEE